MAGQEVDIEVKLILEAIYERYHYDFRDYAGTSLRRRLKAAMQRFECQTLSQLQGRLLREPEVIRSVLGDLTVQVSEMFRDPEYFLALREQVVPVLRTYPSLRLWVAGCSGGEEAYSLAILMKEEGLLERTLIYATDINQEALAQAQAGVYRIDLVPGFSENYRLAGGTGSLSDHYTAAYDHVLLDKSLKDRIVFSDHSLSTDSVFAEVQLVSCRNVLIYFNRALQDRAFGLFSEALCRNGFLGLGARETIRFSSHAGDFIEIAARERIYQKRSPGTPGGDD
ncbi:MAG: protein-glutamate O-methyltransferase CheR [Mitsuaria chitosanitabida]|uniref:CheR family methyltransferase n=1 Tax=Roseateles chitosanitabidus TaxID=65048 RepID=UPI001AFF9130|nr:protein-glutamate O-methyltransferase CheR [Roseateles chitosanitabidus]MBO9687839.1 protein-glutamate O-methyltransferase CheR [Roseateles chitosanitabidus]